MHIAIRSNGREVKPGDRLTTPDGRAGHFHGVRQLRLRTGPVYMVRVGNLFFHPDVWGLHVVAVPNRVASVKGGAE